MTYNRSTNLLTDRCTTTYIESVQHGTYNLSVKWNGKRSIDILIILLAPASGNICSEL